MKRIGDDIDKYAADLWDEEKFANLKTKAEERYFKPSHGRKLKGASVDSIGIVDVVQSYTQEFETETNLTFYSNLAMASTLCHGLASENMTLDKKASPVTAR